MAKTVVVVDDEPGFREVLQDILEDEGYVVHTALDGADALTLLRSLPSLPSVVLCDMIMPRLDGAGLHREVRADPALQGLQFVFLSTDPQRAIPDEPFIQKPPGLKTILDIVKTCCDRDVNAS